MCILFSLSFLFFSLLHSVRRFCHYIVTLRYFDTMIMIVIALSSIALAAEDPIDPDNKRNKVCSSSFLLLCWIIFCKYFEENILLHIHVTELNLIKVKLRLIATQIKTQLAIKHTAHCIKRVAIEIKRNFAFGHISIIKLPLIWNVALESCVWNQRQLFMQNLANLHRFLS